MHSTQVTVGDQSKASLKETKNEHACSQLSDQEDVLWNLELVTRTSITTDRCSESLDGAALHFQDKSQNTNGIACNITNNIRRNIPKF
jgi:hypothetical protein